jgi:nucleolin
MPTEDERKLFVAGLPQSITEEVLRQLFETTGGKVVDVSLPKDRTTGRPRGFGFVTFATPEEAMSAREALDGSIQAGRPISVRAFKAEAPRRSESPGRATERERSGSERTLYVGNLPYDCSQQQVEELLVGNGVGPIVRVHIPQLADGRSRGYGFVTMGSADAASQAIETLRGVELQGRRLQINVAQPRSERPGPVVAERHERSVRPHRDVRTGTPQGPRADSFPPPPPDAGLFFDDPLRAHGGRRRAERPEKADKKKRRGKGKVERADSGLRRTREHRHQRKWEDWDED